jgi:hypothetical protein
MQLIAFTREPQYAAQQSWWRELTGAEPENVLDRPQKRERAASGTLQGVSLALGIDLLRVHWTASPRVDAENLNLVDQPAMLGQFVDRQRWFRDLMTQWLPRCPPITRLAFTAGLFQPVADHVGGYQLLDRYLRSVDVDPQSSDILYRINRRIDSATGVPGLVINRLSTWAVAKFGFLVQTVVAGGQPQGEQELLRGERFGCALDLDINTAPELQGQLPVANLPAIFAELVEAAVEIARRGDTRP